MALAENEIWANGNPPPLPIEDASTAANTDVGLGLVCGTPVHIDGLNWALHKYSRCLYGELNSATDAAGIAYDPDNPINIADAINASATQIATDLATTIATDLATIIATDIVTNLGAQIATDIMINMLAQRIINTGDGLMGGGSLANDLLLEIDPTALANLAGFMSPQTAINGGFVAQIGPLLLQSKPVSASPNTITNVTFPQAFSAPPMVVIFSGGDQNNNAKDNDPFVVGGSGTTVGCQLYTARDGSVPGRIFAVGPV